MRSKLVLTVSFILLAVSAGHTLALDLMWTNETLSGLWNEPNNWSPAVVPSIAGGDKAKVNDWWGAPWDAHINAGMTAECEWLAVGDIGWAGYYGELHMTGGTLNVAAPGSGDSWTIIGYGPSDTGFFTMDGGTMTTSNRVYIGFQGYGELRMNGGTMNIGGTFGIGFGEVFSTGRGHVYLDGGTINVTGGEGLLMSSPAGCQGFLDIAGGTLNLKGDQTIKLQSYIDAGYITGYNGLGTIQVNYNSEPNTTTASAIYTPQKARYPNPANHAVDVSANPMLRWTSGSGAVSHNLYFGSTNPPAFVRNQTANTYDPGRLQFNTTYYWRIDEVNSLGGVATGNIWSFKTVSGKAVNPNPTDGQTDVAINSILSWSAGWGTPSHNVYFGTAYPGTFRGNQPGTSFNPGTLTQNTTYYWRIDEVDQYGTTAGNVWSFTTVQTKASNPRPASSAVNVPVNSTLSWTAGNGALSHNVYFGISNPPNFYVNQAGTDFMPSVLNFNTTYYWRVDEVGSSNTVTGDLWTITTGSGLAENPDPVNGAIKAGKGTVLRWTAGYGATSHDIYLGTDASGVEAAGRWAIGDLDQSGLVGYEDLSILASYWLQDPVGSVPYAGVNDDNVVDFSDYALLIGNWNAQSNPNFKGNTAATTYDDAGNFALNTTYYWRVDEVTGSQTRKGNVWSFTVTDTDSNYSLVGKIMCGYQGWFNCPGDGSSRGWVHWGRSGFTPTNCTVDMWPDMSEMSEGEKFLASAFNDSNDHYVFSPYKRDTVLRHFQWMQQYGIDGVYLQRFATEVITPGTPEREHRDKVFEYCRDGASLYGRVYAVMYDLSGLGSGQITKVKNDWKYLVDTLHLGKNPDDPHGYMFHRGKPVVAVWGIGFAGRAYSHYDCYNLVNFLKNDAVYGGNIVVVGVNDDWRTNPDSWVQKTVALADIISPWTVGRYGNPIDFNDFVMAKQLPDKAWCNTNSKEYLPVIFPGFSWHNLMGGALNQIPRVGGQFLWDQVYTETNTVDANMIYVAMFDEVDEGTAIFKVTNNPPRLGGMDMFVTYDIDGYPLPSDEYLWLVGQAGKALRGEIPAASTRPSRP
jgi:hypothetical protein